MKKPRAEREKSAIYLGLWAAAAALAVFFALRQYMYFQSVVPNGSIGEGGDFYAYLVAARNIASGHSPYDLQLVHRGYGYAYSPFVALVLLPFRTLSTRLLWRTWTSLSIIVLVICSGLFARYASPFLRRWNRPVFFSFIALTALGFGATRWELYNGQTDTFVLLLLLVSSLAAECDQQGLSGALVGGGVVVKSWPGLVALTLFRRRFVNRSRALIGFFGAAFVAPVLAVIVGGSSGLASFLRVTLEGSSQQDQSYSVWGAPKVLFSASRLAKPLVVSGILRDVSTIVLVIAAVGLLLLALRWSDSSLLSYWNIVGCTILLLPVSHLAYTLYFLPILWIWTLRALAASTFEMTSFTMTVVMLLWWLFMNRYGLVQSHSESSLHYMSPFFGDFFVFTTSVLFDHRRRKLFDAGLLLDSVIDRPLSAQKKADV